MPAGSNADEVLRVGIVRVPVHEPRRPPDVEDQGRPWAGVVSVEVIDRERIRARRIDAFQLTAPTSTVVEKEGFGTVIIRGSQGEVKELDDYPYFGMVVQESFASQKADIVKRFIRATRKGVAFIRSDLDGTVQSVQAFFKRMSPDILKAGVQTALPAYSEDGRINEQIVTRYLDLAYSVKLLTLPARPSPKEGVLWTNGFIE